MKNSICAGLRSGLCFAWLVCCSPITSAHERVTPDTILAEATASPTAAPTFQSGSCPEARWTWVGLSGLFFLLAIFRFPWTATFESERQEVRDDEGDSEGEERVSLIPESRIGKTFLDIDRSEDCFVADQFSTQLEAEQFREIDYSLTIRGEPLIIHGQSNNQNRLLAFFRIVFTSVKHIVAKRKVWSKAAFFGSVAGLLGALYTENGKAEFDTELKKLSAFYNTIEYLPAVFLGFYTTAEMNRLYLIMSAMLSLSTTTVNIGTRLSAMVSPPVHSVEHRRWLFKMYRYLSLQHYLCYSELVFGSASSAEMNQIVDSGLLLRSEAHALRGMAYGLGHHHMVSAWLSQEYLAKYSPTDAVTEGFLGLVSKLNAQAEDVHDLVSVHHPFVGYAFLMHLFVYLSSALIAVAYAYDFWVDNECWQPIGAVSTFFVSWCYFALIQLSDNVSRPFATDSQHVKVEADKLNPETLLLNTEASLFDVMRSGFGEVSKERFDSYKTEVRRPVCSSAMEQSFRSLTELESLNKLDSDPP